MTKMSSVKKSMITAVCAAFCVILPMTMHSFPNAGILLSPMHIPVLLCGLTVGWPFGLLCGIIGPLLSHLFMGMPAVMNLPGMMVELAAFGCIAGLLMQLVHTGKLIFDLYISLLTAMLAGRIIAGLANGLLFSAGSYTLKAWATVYFVKTFPGILLQLILIPLIYFALEQARLVPLRYKETARTK